MVGSEVEKFGLEDYLSREIAHDDDSPITQLNQKNSVYLRSPYEFSSTRNDQCLCICSWNVHVTSNYLDILQLLDDFSSQFDVAGLCETLLRVN